ncbi:Sensor histidine kinase LiaS [Thermobacillus xylanilyticus]|uniref:Oxygen sensor histidine kinase NreB n=1 Tax=Thermobacillus xylanilyticus TaxID=76633 RepID=A0ABM8V329_THEXY|nr:sensor histidine kinase [Thermobacillus xylanilyticus]CAG5084220.1 Sensor histidine kinase LiaS [Thermobacillus xylanilyticus]
MSADKMPGRAPAGPGRPRDQAKPKRNAAETLLWLVVLLGLMVLVLQGTGYLKIFKLQEKTAAFVLTLIGLGLAVAALYSYLQGVKLKQTLMKLAEQQLKRRPVTLPGADGEGGEASGEDENPEERMRKEQLKFKAITEERQRLARELHDAVSQQLFAISMTATAVKRTLDKDFERAKRQVELIEEMASVAQSEMRALLLHLRPVHLDGKRLPQALEALVEELQQKVPNMVIALDQEPHLAILPEAEDHLFRIVQEALSNTLRHARASRMDISLRREQGQLHLLMRDDGVGFDMEAKKQTSYGLLTMEERVHEMGGTMTLRSAPGEGTEIDIRVPVLMEERDG